MVVHCGESGLKIRYNKEPKFSSPVLEREMHLRISNSDLEVLLLFILFYFVCLLVCTHIWACL